MPAYKKQNKPKGAWSPYVLAIIAYVFSGFPALILMAINFGRYGYPKRRTFWLSVTPILFLLLYTMDWISSGGMTQRDFAFRMLTIWITYSQQIGLHRDWKAPRSGLAGRSYIAGDRNFVGCFRYGGEGCSAIDGESAFYFFQGLEHSFLTFRREK